MKKNRKTISKVISERIQENCKNLIEEYKAEKDPHVKLEIKYDLARKTLKHLILEIASLTEAEWQDFLKNKLNLLVRRGKAGRTSA